MFPSVRTAALSLLVSALALGCGGGPSLSHLEISPRDGAIATLATVPGTTDLVAVCATGSVWVIDAAAGEYVRQLGPVLGAGKAVVSASGEAWIVGTVRGSSFLARVDVETGEERERFAYSSYVNWIGTTPDGDFVHVDVGGTTLIYDGRSGEHLHSIRHEAGQIATSSTLSLDGKTAVTRSTNDRRTLQVVMPEVGSQPTQQFRANGEGDWLLMGLTPDGDHLLAHWITYMGGENSLLVIDTTEGEVVKRAKVETPPYSLTMLESGKAVWGYQDGRIEVVDPLTLERVFEKQVQGGRIFHHMFAPLLGGTWGATADADGTIRVFALR